MADRKTSLAHIPRFLITAAASNSGKTTITAALLRCLQRKGMQISAYKCGPDYIDPMFHRSVLGTPCRNLDLFFSSEDEIRTLLAESSGAQGADLAVLEGVMGFYDGLGGRSTQASAYHVCRTTSTPAILVIDGQGTSLTLAAAIKGLKDFREQSNVCGVIINRCSAAMYSMFKGFIAEECGVNVIGHVPKDERLALESRHLGLVTAQEVEDLHSRLEHAADILDECLDIDALLALAESAPDIEYELSCVVPEVDADDEVTIAVASDKAFCFYYEESLEVLRRLGANIVEFSPLVDSDLPDGTCAIYLGGGYPELYAQQLSENLGMLQAIRDAYDAHMPIFAECGGFLYLKENMRDQQGRLWPMAGILPGSAEYTGHLKRFGYVELAAQTSGMGFNAGDTVRAHEFHYYDSDFNGQAFLAQKAASKRSWECGVLEERLLAGFPHLYLPACEGFARGFVRAAADYKAESAR